jgi:DNA-binding winged helix-turn-helix (wHTH) protein
MRLAFLTNVLDVPRRDLTVDGRSVHVSPKAFDLLCLLAEVAPAVVSKAAITERLWPDTHVTDNSLAGLVAELREALRDDARQPRVIRTVHRVGYAFCAEGRAAAARPVRYWLLGGDLPVALPDGEFVVGRDPQSPCRVDAPSVSRRHARLVVVATGVQVHDLASKNGTFLDDRRLDAPGLAQDGTVVRFGSVPFTLRAADALSDTRTADGAAV